MKKLWLFFSCIHTFVLHAQTGKENQTPEYNEIIRYYHQLDVKYPEGKLIHSGKTDIGKPLHVFVIAGDQNFNPLKQNKNKCVLLINNGIHPGEPDGINASMQLANEILSNKNKYANILNHVTICIIPVYNVDGCLNRGSSSRANQDGPEEYGFRGNARNLDLNRDFIKMDSENAKSFASVFRAWKPQLMIDTHVSNGADYQYTFTYILSQKEKLHPQLQPYHDSLEQKLINKMRNREEMISPYVNTVDETPNKGIAAFIESPRYASGYAALFNCIGLTTETHMLKPFPKRVKATYAALMSMLEIAAEDHIKIIINYKNANVATQTQKIFPLNYVNDTSIHKTIEFLSFKPVYKKSEVTGLNRLYYDRAQPEKILIPYYHASKATLQVSAPQYYIIPQAWKEVIERLKLNKVFFTKLTQDEEREVECIFIDSVKSNSNPFEGHYFHQRFTTTTKNQKIKFYAGDIVVPVNQESNRFIVEVLEPLSIDAYFRWNFFDEILQQKEWFSDYVFEDVAAQILLEDKVLREELEKKKKEDSKFAADAFAQLYFVYKHSKYYEPSHMRLPVFRQN